MAVNDPSSLDRDAFIARFGPVYEASPWVAEAVWPAAERGALDTQQNALMRPVEFFQHKR